MRAFLRRRRKAADQAVLDALLRDDVWRYGLDLMRSTKLRPGRFYPAIGRLEARGLAEAMWDPAAPTDRHRRRMYRATEGIW